MSSLIGTILLYEDIFESVKNFPNLFIDEIDNKLYSTVIDLYNNGITITPDNVHAKSGVPLTHIEKQYELAMEKNIFVEKFEELKKLYINQNIAEVQRKYQSGYYLTINEYISDLDNITSLVGDSKTETRILKETYKRYHEKEVESRLLTGIGLIDKFKGLKKEAMIILGARPGVGKSSYMVEMIKNDMKNKYKIGVFSLEMSDTELIQKLMANELCIDENILDLKMYSNETKTRVYGYMDRTIDYPLVINDNPNTDIDSMCRMIRKWDKKYNCDKYYIDYLQYIPVHKKMFSETEKVMYVSKKLTRLKKELGKQIIALAQINRGVDTGKETREPRVSDLKQSGQIEQDADVIFLLHEEMKLTETKSKMKLIIGKNRKGATGIINMFFEKQYSKFTEAYHD